MEQSLQIFGPALAFVDGKLDSFLHDRVVGVIALVEGPLRAALVLYVMLYGFAIMRGAISEPIVDFAIRSIKLALIYQLATTAAYSSWIIDPLFHQMPAALTTAISGAPSANLGAAFDQFLNQAAYLGETIARTTTPAHLEPLVVSAVVYGIGALAATLGFGVAIMAKVALAMIIALGPIFVACALFDASRRFFFGWLSQAINYIVLMALVVLIFQLVLSLVVSQWDAIAGQEPLKGGLVFIALSILGAIFFLQTPNIAAGVAGGASAGLADFGRALGLGSRPAVAAHPVTAPAPGSAPIGGSVAAGDRR
jgi:type IV secretion system protein VirB6